MWISDADTWELPAGSAKAVEDCALLTTVVSSSESVCPANGWGA